MISFASASLNGKSFELTTFGAGGGQIEQEEDEKEKEEEKRKRAAAAEKERARALLSPQPMRKLWWAAKGTATHTLIFSEREKCLKRQYLSLNWKSKAFFVPTVDTEVVVVGGMP